MSGFQLAFRSAAAITFGLWAVEAVLLAVTSTAGYTVLLMAVFGSMITVALWDIARRER